MTFLETTEEIITRKHQNLFPTNDLSSFVSGIIFITRKPLYSLLPNMSPTIFNNLSSAILRVIVFLCLHNMLTVAAEVILLEVATKVFLLHLFSHSINFLHLIRTCSLTKHFLSMDSVEKQKDNIMGCILVLHG